MGDRYVIANVASRDAYESLPGRGHERRIVLNAEGQKQIKLDILVTNFGTSLVACKLYIEDL